MMTCMKRVLVGGTLAGLLMMGAVAGAQGVRPRGAGGEPRFPVAEVVRVVREATGLSNAEVLRALRAGQTLAELIAANGGDADAVAQTVLTVAEARLTEAVARGRITQDVADALLAALPDQIEAVLNGEAGALNGLRGRGPRGGVRGAMGQALPRISEAFVLDVASAQTGLTTRALRETVREGQTLAAVLAANNVTQEAFLSALEAGVAAVLAPAVERGRISQQLADALAAEARLRVEERLAQ